jgi:ankyrin repeat protein
MNILEAAETGNLIVFNQYMEHENIRMELNNKDSEGNTVLMIACKNSQILIVTKISELLKKQPDWPNCPEINQVNTAGESPLILVCRFSNNIYLLHLLLNTFPNINVNIRSNMGNNAIINACVNLHTNFVQRLLLVPGINVTIPNKQGFTPLGITQRKLDMIANNTNPAVLIKINKCKSIINHITNFLIQEQRNQQLKFNFNNRR